MKTKFERDRAERRADKKDREQRRHVLYNRIGMVVAALIIGGVIYAIVGGARVQRSVPRPATPVTDANGVAVAPAAARAPCPTRTGEAWEYDRPTDCHFDPSPQHAHWHAGRPPDGTERVRRMLDGGGTAGAEPVSIDAVPAPAPTPPPTTAPPFADPD